MVSYVALSSYPFSTPFLFFSKTTFLFSSAFRLIKFVHLCHELRNLLVGSILRIFVGVRIRNSSFLGFFGVSAMLYSSYTCLHLLAMDALGFLIRLILFFLFFFAWGWIIFEGSVNEGVPRWNGCDTHGLRVASFLDGLGLGGGIKLASLGFSSSIWAYSRLHRIPGRGHECFISVSSLRFSPTSFCWVVLRLIHLLWAVLDTWNGLVAI